jgi:hypothetical protein
VAAAGARERLDYSRRHGGASMLKRIRPERVRVRCTRRFAPACAALLHAAPAD